jgi:ankyrin repeat protein
MLAPIEGENSGFSVSDVWGFVKRGLYTLALGDWPGKGYDLAAVEKFLTAGSDPLATDDRDWTALHWAAAEGRIDVIEKLKAERVDFNAQDIAGRTPLHVAAERGHKEAVSKLLQYGATHNALTYRGSTPLLRAAAHGHLPIVKILARLEGADLNHRNRSGNSGLHLSARNGHVLVASFLLTQRVNADIHNKKGFSARQLGRQKGGEIADLLEIFDQPPAILTIGPGGVACESGRETTRSQSAAASARPQLRC